MTKLEMATRSSAVEVFIGQRRRELLVMSGEARSLPPVKLEKISVAAEVAAASGAIAAIGFAVAMASPAGYQFIAWLLEVVK